MKENKKKKDHRKTHDLRSVALYHNEKSEMSKSSQTTNGDNSRTTTVQQQPI